MCIPILTASLFIIAKVWKQRKGPSTDEQLKHMWYIYNGILLNHKKEWNFAISNNMNGLGGYYAKRNKPDRESQIPDDITSMRNLKNKDRNRVIDTENKLVAARGEICGGMNEIVERD